MAREIPEAVRAVAGLAATVLDEVRKLPDTLPGLPVRLAGLAMQTSLRVQQQYSGLVARGDELLTGLRGEHEPGLATFDEDLPEPSARSSAFDRVAEPWFDDDHEDGEIESAALADEVADDLAVADLPVAGVDELAVAVVDEVAEEMPDAVPDEVLDDLTTGSAADDVIEGQRTIDEAVEEAVSDGALADAVVAGEPPAPREVPSLADVTPDTAPDDTATLDDATPDVAALEEAGEELVDLGGPDAAASVAPSAPDAGTAVTAPIEGYDAFSIPALRGRLRAYPAETVADLLDYERATRARAPYVTLLQNRLEKLNADRG
jgi:hypothetical protein